MEGGVTGSSYDVFLSYSHDDKALAEDIAARIIEAGFSCWIDKKNLRAGERYNPAIDLAIDGARVFVAFLSVSYVNKSYCCHEFDRAIEKDKSKVAVCIDAVSENTNRQSGYMFSACTGYNIPGFGGGIDKDNPAEYFADEIINSIPLQMLKPDGDGYRTKKRFAKFNNLPELMAMYKEFADIQTADMLDLPVPKIESGKPQTIVTEPNDFQKAYMKILAERSENCHSGRVDASKDNMLKITGEARLLGLDARCLNPEAQNYPDSKVNALIENVLKIYTATTERKGVQAIFCDIAVHGDNETEEQPDSKKKSKKAKSEKGDEGKFSVYNYIKAELIRRGVPADEICFAGDADTNKKQNEMRAQLRSGAKRIVIASTSKLGTGANIQTKLCALHNLDIPWKPSDVDRTKRNAL